MSGAAAATINQLQNTLLELNDRIMNLQRGNDAARKVIVQKDKVVDELRERETARYDVTRSESIASLREEIRLLEIAASEKQRKIASMAGVQKVREGEILRLTSAAADEQGPRSFAAIHREKTMLDGRLAQAQRQNELLERTLSSQALRLATANETLASLAAIARNDVITDPATAAAAADAVAYLTAAAPAPAPLAAPARAVSAGRTLRASSTGRVARPRSALSTATKAEVVQLSSGAVSAVQELARTSGSVVGGVSGDAAARLRAEEDAAQACTTTVPRVLFELAVCDVLRLNGQLFAAVGQVQERTDEMTRLAAALAEAERATAAAERRVRVLQERAERAAAQHGAEVTRVNAAAAADVQMLRTELHGARTQLHRLLNATRALKAEEKQMATLAAKSGRFEPLRAREEEEMA